MDHRIAERFNAARWLLEANATRAGKLAYIDDHTRLDYGGLADRVRRAAAGLLAMGLRREERVLLLMHDSIDFPVAFLGALHAGIVPVPVNTLLTTADYAYMLQHCGAQAAIVSPALWPMLREALAQARCAAPVLAAGTGPAPDGTRSLASLQSAAPLAAAADTGADDIAFWLYSSGSTGRPKGTVHTHANLHWTAELYGKAVLGLRESDIVFSAAKLFFAYGLGNALTFPLSVGAPQKTVTPCSVQRLKTAAGVGRSAIRTVVAPTDSGKVSALPRP